MYYNLFMKKKKVLTSSCCLSHISCHFDASMNQNAPTVPPQQGSDKIAPGQPLTSQVIR